MTPPPTSYGGAALAHEGQKGLSDNVGYENRSKQRELSLVAKTKAGTAGAIYISYQ